MRIALTKRGYITYLDRSERFIALLAKILN